MDEKKYPGYEKHKEIAVCPAAPYDNSGYDPDDEGVIKPPTAPPLEIPTQERMPVANVGSLSEQEIRDACLEFASENCCYGTKFIRDAEFPEIFSGCTYHYQLSTFGEKRESVLRHEPFRGQFVDGPENGYPPGPWDMQVAIPSMFQDIQVKTEIPHTAYVKECGRCVGNCRVRCDSCYGRGGTSCYGCSGRGRNNGQQCTTCYGTGRRRCWNCSGTGQVKCGTCDGLGNLRYFRQLIVTWKNHAESFVTETFNLPKMSILQVTGRELFREQNSRVYPINHAPDDSVNLASMAMIEKHATAFPQEFIRQQKHTLQAIPLTRVKYTWKRKQGEFYVYGFQKKVFFEDYPQKCCCCTCC